MKNSIYLILVLLTFSCKPVEKVNKQQESVVTTTTKAEYDQYIKDTQLRFLDKIPNKIRLYGQILCPGVPRPVSGIDKPIDLKINEIFDLKYRPQICGKFEYSIRKVIEGDTILLKKSIKTDAKGRYDMTLDFGHYLLQPKLDKEKLGEFASNIRSKPAKKYFLQIVKRTWVVVSEKDTAITLNLRAIREDQFKSVIERHRRINAPIPM